MTLVNGHVVIANGSSWVCRPCHAVLDAIDAFWLVECRP